jgi:hypothetical protein
MNKFLVLTTINKPTKAVEVFAKHKDWNIVVVGDKKTPKSWKFKGVHYLSVEDQKKLFPKLSKLIPWNSYSRKNIGYLYSIKNGAEIIADGDDDNIPLKNWGKIPNKKNGWVINGDNFFNVYSLFTQKKVWPRGFPLDEINKKGDFEFSAGNVDVGVWQFMVDKDPDVDAIYRLIDGEEIYFKKRASVLVKQALVRDYPVKFKEGNISTSAELVVLGKGVLCPTNSQNSLFLKKAFSTLYLPSFVNFRATDIFRGYISQPLLWNMNMYTGFAGPSAIQERNPHNYLDDFESEIPVYKFAGRISKIVKGAISENLSLEDNLLRGYQALIKEGLLQKKETVNLEIWLNVISKYIY